MASHPSTADLHIHTHFSDGADAPAQVVERARPQGLSAPRFGPEMKEGARSAPSKRQRLRSSAAAYRLEAVKAVHRPRARRHERHLRLLAAVRADRVVKNAG